MILGSFVLAQNGSIRPYRCWQFKIRLGQTRALYHKTFFTTGPREIAFQELNSGIDITCCEEFESGLKPTFKKRLCWRFACSKTRVLKECGLKNAFVGGPHAENSEKIKNPKIENFRNKNNFFPMTSQGLRQVPVVEKTHKQDILSPKT